MLSKSRRLPIKDFFGPQAPKPFRIARNQAFSIKIYNPQQKYSRFGVVVSKKIADKASARVKIKRTVFNFVRVNQKNIALADYLIIPSPTVSKLDRAIIQQDLSDLLLSRTFNY